MFRRLAISLVLFVTPALFAQTTGNLTGRITDTNGGALPGVTIEVKSPVLQGTRTAASERDGNYRFALLPPGEYAVTFRLEGLAPETKSGGNDFSGDAFTYYDSDSQQANAKSVVSTARTQRRRTTRRQRP